uniref:MOSC domain-containing protein n=1 Tax=Heterorhabditis bacteriophora TaxID=37862 RepID=A0A1I7XSB3_HETBA
MNFDDKKVLLVVIGTSVLVYNAAIRIWNYVNSRKSPFIPVGTIQALYIYPVKSCKAKSVFSFYCDLLGPSSGELLDRHFMVINGDTGRFYTARQKPSMIMIDCDIQEGILTLQIPSGDTVKVNLMEVKNNNDVRQATLHENLRTDGLDCGNEVADFLSRFIDEPSKSCLLLITVYKFSLFLDTRLVMYTRNLFTERTCIPKQSWWNNNSVPIRKDDCAYADLSPYMITTQASLDKLNMRLGKEVTNLHFRPVIVIDHCAAWDEDKWIDLRIGNTELQCFKPCTRCVMVTIDPLTGIKDKEVQPLKTLREFRLAPYGDMRDEFKDSPIFGVNCGLNRPGYIHIGQTVYARYKRSEF